MAWSPSLAQCCAQFTDDFLRDRLKSFSAPWENHRAPQCLSLHIHFHPSHAYVRLQFCKRTAVCAAALGVSPSTAPLGESSLLDTPKDKTRAEEGNLWEAPVPQGQHNRASRPGSFCFRAPLDPGKGHRFRFKQMLDVVSINNSYFSWQVVWKRFEG